MRSTALKHEVTYETAEQTDVVRLQLVHIAQEAEAACQLPGNDHGCDFEAFLSKYGKGTVSDFA